MFDARGMTIVPGFIDCHNHAGGEMLLYEVLVGNPFEVEFVTIDSIIEKLRAKARKTPPGTWVEGYFYDDTKVKDKRPLNVHDLDQVSKEHPVVGAASRRPHVVLQQQGARDGGHHEGHAESAGRHVRSRRERRANGRVTDRAQRRASRGSGKRPTFTRGRAATARRATAIAHISKQFVRYGLTSVHHEGGDLARDAGGARARRAACIASATRPTGRVLEAMIGERHRNRLRRRVDRFGATSEHTVDGSFSERTMALSMPYPGRTPAYKGNVTETQEELERLGRARAPRRHSGQLPRQRRRRDRHVS